jgi:hypothetical protein
LGLADRVLRRDFGPGLGLSVAGLCAAQTGGGRMKILEFLFMVLAMIFVIVVGLIALVVYLVGAIVFTALQGAYVLVRFVFSFWKKSIGNDYPKRSEMDKQRWTSNQTLEGLTLEQVNELTLRIVEIVEGMGGFVAGGFEQETSDEPRPDQNQ